MLLHQPAWLLQQHPVIVTLSFVCGFFCISILCPHLDPCPQLSVLMLLQQLSRLHKQHSFTPTFPCPQLSMRMLLQQFARLPQQPPLNPTKVPTGSSLP